MSRKDQIDRFIKEAAEYEDDGEPQFTPEEAARYAEYRGRRAQELQQWGTWKKTKKPEHLTPLLKSMAPLIRNEASKRMQGLGGSISRAGIENELLNSAVRSIHTYDPSRGTSLTTHVVGGFRRISDYVNQNRNDKYIPSEDMKRYDTYRNASEELRQELGRDPTHLELKERLPAWSTKTIQKMQRSFGRSLYTDMGDALTAGQDRTQLPARSAFHLAYSELSPLEQRFGDLYFKPEGEPLPPIANVARALGISPEKAYRVKANVETRMSRYRKGE